MDANKVNKNQQPGQPMINRGSSFPGEMEFTFLGTGAAIPSKYRNVSSTLIRFRLEKSSSGRAWKSILLDCGEGTYFQMCRRYGTNRAREIVQRELELIWVSHMHADHHLGLMKLLLTRNENPEMKDKVFIVAPSAMLTFLQEYEEVDTSISGSYKFFSCGPETKPIVATPAACLTKPPTLNSVATDNSIMNDSFKDVKTRLGLSSLVNVPVQHCFDAFGLVLEFSSGLKVVYSGDTEPCDALVKAGMNAEILIHEATLDDEKEAEAREKKHSTVSEAVNVGKRMQARRTILTHFSQRYPKIPIISTATATGDNNSERNEACSDSTVVVAFDLMSLTLGQLEFGHLLLPILQQIFSNETSLEG